MGSVFPLIADSALRAADPSYYTQCQVCERSVPVYPCQGSPVLENGEADPNEDVYVACADCLKAGRVQHIDEYYFNGFIRRHARDPETSIALLRQTPRIPLCVQDTDWPFCCGEPTEFVGEPTPTEAEALDQAGQYWQFGLSTFGTPVSQLVPSDTLAVIGGASAFRCRVCGRDYWIFQFT